MNNDHDPEPPIVEEVIREAQETVKRFASLLQALGWDAIVISLTRVIEVAPGDVRSPGAAATVLDRARCGPVASQLADVLRMQAQALDARAGGERVDSGYIQDASDYASDLQEWPR